MRFWDASAIVPLLVREPVSLTLEDLYRDDPVAVVWWATEVECSSALSRREREAAIPVASSVAALDRLDALKARWIEVAPTAEVRGLARRLLRVHPLRSADSLQLAAALAFNARLGGSVPMVCLDDRLAEAARREELRVVP